jgi:hypothetical protein
MNMTRALVVFPESFYVTATAGPLVDGETERASRWGEELGKGFLGDPEAAEGAQVPSESRAPGR